MNKSPKKVSELAFAMIQQMRAADSFKYFSIEYLKHHQYYQSVNEALQFLQLFIFAFCFILDISYCCICFFFQ